jgi:hypothetical protein
MREQVLYILFVLDRYQKHSTKPFWSDIIDASRLQLKICSEHRKDPANNIVLKRRGSKQQNRHKQSHLL